MKKIKVLLYSGGMDSYLIRKLWEPDMVLYVKTGSKYSPEEFERIKEDPEISVVDFLDLREFEREDFIIPYRNVYLCLAALNKVESKWPLELEEKTNEEYDREIEICLGATKGDRVLDKSYSFAGMLSDLLTYLSSTQHWTGGKCQRVSIVLPYKQSTKRDLLRAYCDKCGGRQSALLDVWNNSFSCYTPVDGKPCGKCKPCFRKTVAFVLEGFNLFPIRDYAMRAREYIESSGILEQIKNGTYGRAEEEKDILEFMEVTKNW